MVHMIVLTEVFIVFKHGQNDFSHAKIPFLGYFFLGALIIIFLTILIKVMISDIINWNRKNKNKTLQTEPYPQIIS
jgi:hypothetical protein